MDRETAHKLLDLVLNAKHKGVTFEFTPMCNNGAHIVHLSAKTGEGMDRLLSLIPRTIGFGETAFDGALITNARQAAALARAAERCEAALYAAQCGMTPDAVVMDAEGAIAALGEITGETVTESVVTRIFSDFCVGK